MRREKRALRTPSNERQEQAPLRLLCDHPAATCLVFDVPRVCTAGAGWTLCRPDEHLEGLESLNVRFEVKSERLESKLRLGRKERPTPQHGDVGAIFVPRRPLHTVNQQ